MDRPIDPRVEIGHVHLKVANLDRALAFYSGVLGFDVTQRMGTSAAFLSADGDHDHIGLNTWESRDGAPPAPRTSGPYHFAIRYPDRTSLGAALRRLQAANVPLDGASDHGVSEALYLRDPDGNGLELYWDRPRDEWRWNADGTLDTVTVPLDLEALIRDGSPGARGPARGPSSPPVLNDARRIQLGELRTRLLNLHKALLDDAKANYEMDRGSVGSSANLLQLVINDPWFAWLHSVSELVVRIDETLTPDSPATDADGIALAEQVEKLLTASENGEGFQRRYYEALQRQPAVVLAHAEVRRTLKSMKA
jgi:catechol 2,3-dioxygenase